MAQSPGLSIKKARKRPGYIRRYVRDFFINNYELHIARHDHKMAVLKARVRLAAFEAKSNIEWDMKWMSPLDKTWRGDVLVVLWSLPIASLFIPFTRPFGLYFFEHLKDFSPDAPTFYIGGWAIIFAATFGVRQVLSMLPGRYSRLVTAFGQAPADVPDAAAEAAQEAVTPPEDQEPLGETSSAKAG